MAWHLACITVQVLIFFFLSGSSYTCLWLPLVCCYFLVSTMPSHLSRSVTRLRAALESNRTWEITLCLGGKHTLRKIRGVNWGIWDVLSNIKQCSRISVYLSLSGLECFSCGYTQKRGPYAGIVGLHCQAETFLHENRLHFPGEIDWIFAQQYGCCQTPLYTRIIHLETCWQKKQQYQNNRSLFIWVQVHGLCTSVGFKVWTEVLFRAGNFPCGTGKFLVWK